MSSRTADEVKTDMGKVIASIDPSIEVEYGPINDAVLLPVSGEISKIEGEADRLSQLYSTEFIKIATDTEVNGYVTNFALATGSGSNSTGYAIFITFSKVPNGVSIIIPQGTLVSNADNTLVYQTTEERTMIGDNSSSYYNAAEGWYQISVPIQAIQPGTAYNLPMYRITKIMTPIQGIDAVQNVVKLKGGTDAEDTTKKFERVESAFQGLNLGSINGVIKIVQDYSPENITGVAIVRSSERDLFKRFTDKLALDVYVNGFLDTNTTVEYKAEQKTNNFIIAKQPVTSIDNVLVNGIVATNYQLEKDTGIYRDSTSAEDKLVLENSVEINDVVTIGYTYNSLLENITNDIFGVNEDNLFDMDILVREMIREKITLSCYIVISSSATEDVVIADVIDKLYALIENNINGYTYTPETIRQTLISEVTGLSDLIWDKFTLTATGKLNVEVISLDKNSVGIVDQTALLVRKLG
jgi:hypothetical protein